MNRHCALAHDFFGKPMSTFPDQLRAACPSKIRQGPASDREARADAGCRRLTNAMRIVVGLAAMTRRPAMKRALDAVISAFGLIVLMPPMLIIAYLVRRSSPGDALFVQTRVDRAEKPFQYKFRAMASGASQGES